MAATRSLPSLFRECNFYLRELMEQQDDMEREMELMKQGQKRKFDIAATFAAAAETAEDLTRARAELIKTPKPGAPLDVAQAVAALAATRPQLRKVQKL